MIALILSLLAVAKRLFCSRKSLLLEILILRQQLAVLKRRRARPSPYHGWVASIIGTNAPRKGIEIRLAQCTAKSGYVSSARIAQLYADLGEKDPAFDWLETAYKERDFWLITLRSDARFDALRAEPRYAELVRKIGFSR